MAVPIYLYNYAESRTELYDMIQWTGSLLKPGGHLIGMAPFARNLHDLENGIYKNDPKFGFQLHFGDEVKEGLFLTQFGDVHGDDFLNLHTHLYSYNTLETLLEISGFCDVRFCEGDDYANRTVSNSSDEERMMFLEFMSYKGCPLKVFTATKQ